jgi:hypothetical protein
MATKKATAPKQRKTLVAAEPQETPRQRKMLDPLAVASGLHSHELPSPEGEEVLVVVPRPFRITRDNHVLVDYAAGTYRMPLCDATHWWAKNNGVTQVS